MQSLTPRKQSCFLLALFFLSLPLVSRAQATAPEKRFSYADLQRLESVDDALLSPDGQAVVYSVRSINLQHDSHDQTFWIMRLSGKTKPVALRNVSAVSWSPEGHTLAVLDRGSAGQTLQLLRSDTLAVVRTCTLPSSPESLVWSPDGKSVAFTLFVPEKSAPSFLQQAVASAEADLEKPSGAQWAAPVRLTQSARYREDDGGAQQGRDGHRHLFVLSTADGALRQVGKEPFDDGDPAWSADSRNLLFTSDRRPGRDRQYRIQAIYRTDLLGHAVRLTSGDDAFSAPRPSPDGKWIAYIQIPSRQANYTLNELKVMHTDGSEPHRLAPGLDRDLNDITWAADARGVYAGFADHGISHVGLFDLEGHSRTVASGLGGSFSVSRDGTIAYSGASADDPDQLMLQKQGKPAEALTALNPFLQQRQLGRLVQLDAKSSSDGVCVEGWALLPPKVLGTGRHPLILKLHGGPFGADGPDWNSENELLAAAGYVVVSANYRGSTSYGSAFSEPANHDFPGVAYADVMSLVDEAIHQGFADPDRLFVTGASAGAELTTWITGKTGRFRAAAAEKPLVNDMSEALSTDQYLAAPLIYGGEPWTIERELWAHSPLSLVGSVTTPTLLVVGEQDFRTPIEETLQWYDALQLRGIPSALLRVPDTGHASLHSRPSQDTAIIAATLAWFHRYDAPQEAKQPDHEDSRKRK